MDSYKSCACWFGFVLQVLYCMMVRIMPAHACVKVRWQKFKIVVVGGRSVVGGYVVSWLVDGCDDTWYF